MLEEALKLVPLTFSVVAALAIETLCGERELSWGTGLFTVNVTTVEGLPPGFATVTVGVPATAIAFAGMLACNSVEFENAVAIVFPLKLTTELDVKLLPDKINMNDGPPAVALAGESVPTTGRRFVPATVNGSGEVIPPPGAGLLTATFSVPPCAKSLAGSVV